MTEATEATDIETGEVTEQEVVDNPTADWTILDDPRVNAILHQSARRAAAAYSEITTVDDELQEGRIHLALNANEARGYLEDPHIGERHLARWLYTELRGNLRTQDARTARQVRNPDANGE